MQAKAAAELESLRVALEAAVKESWEQPMQVTPTSLGIDRMDYRLYYGAAGQHLVVSCKECNKKAFILDAQAGAGACFR